MVLEIAHVAVLPGHEQAFEEALREAVDTVLSRARGFRAFTGAGWGVERPSVYCFTIAWDSLEDHMVGFRESELFAQWRALIGPHFDGVPTVEHFA
jgi:heme-degrading monooxygenase HmoA